MSTTPWRLAMSVDGSGAMSGAAQADGARPVTVSGASASAVATAAAKKHGRSVPREIILVHPGWMSLDEVGERVTTATAAGPVIEEPGAHVFRHGGDPVVEMVRRRMRDSGAFTTQVVLVGPRELTVGVERRLGDVVSGPLHLGPGDLAIGALDPAAVRAAARYAESRPGASAGRGWRRAAGVAAVALAIGGGIWAAENYDGWTGAGPSADVVAGHDPEAAAGRGGDAAPPEPEQLPAAPSRPADGTSVPDLMAHYFTGFDPRPLLLPADDCHANDARLAENIHMSCTGLSREWVPVAAAIPGLAFTENGIPMVSVRFESTSALGFAVDHCAVTKDRELPAAEGFRLIVSEPCDADGNVYPVGEWPEGKTSELRVVHVVGAVVDEEGAIMYPSLSVGSLASSGAAQAIIDYFGIGA